MNDTDDAISAEMKDNRLPVASFLVASRTMRALEGIENALLGLLVEMQKAANPLIAVDPTDPIYPGAKVHTEMAETVPPKKHKASER